MTCPNCLRALQLVVHRTYSDNCMGCAVRKLAYMTCDERERYYDRLQHLSGWEQRVEVVRMVNLERARIRALSAAMPKEKA